MQSLLSKPLQEDLKRLTKESVDRLRERGVDVHLAVVQVGNNEESLYYIDLKAKMAKDLGVIFSIYHLEEGSAKGQVEETLQFLNQDPDVQGVFLQLPLPDYFSVEDEQSLLESITSSKDVDGLKNDWQSLNYINGSLTELLSPRPYAIPPMVCAVLSLLNYYHIELEKKNIVIVGNSRLTAQPLYTFFKKIGANIEKVSEDTTGIIAVTKKADILIADIDQPELITYQWVKEGAVVIDCNADLHFDSVSQIVSAIAPSRGGVGPLTLNWLFYNAVQSALNLEGDSHD